MICFNVAPCCRDPEVTAECSITVTVVSAVKKKMAFKILTRVAVLTRLKCGQTPVGFLSSGSRFEVQHDRPNQRFTVTPDSGAGERSDPARKRRCRQGLCTRSRRLHAACSIASGVDDVLVRSSSIKSRTSLLFIRTSSATKLIKI